MKNFVAERIPSMKNIAIDTYAPYLLYSLYKALVKARPYGGELSRKRLAKKLIKSSCFGVGILRCNLLEVSALLCSLKYLFAFLTVHKRAAYATSPHISKANKRLALIAPTLY